MVLGVAKLYALSSSALLSRGKEMDAVLSVSFSCPFMISSIGRVTSVKIPAGDLR